MQNEIDFEDLTRQTRRLEFEDGLTDLQNAFVFLLMGLLGTVFFSTWGLMLFIRGILFNEELTMLALLAIIPLLVLIMFGGRRLIQRIRRDILWRERGEIVPLKWQVDSKLSVLAFTVWLALTLIGLKTVSRWSMEMDSALRVMIGAAGVATGVVYFAMGRTLRVQRYLWVGPLGGILSLLLMVVPVPSGYSSAVFGVVWCSLLTISGLAALRRTMRDLREV
jgi:hypothetical protein